jgi:hypothetical protein
MCLLSWCHMYLRLLLLSVAVVGLLGSSSIGGRFLSRRFLYVIA